MDDYTAAVEQRFLTYVDKQEECWLWTGHVMNVGYGQFHWNGTKRAHRVAYRLWVGDIPEGSVVHHSCAVRHCVNPKHLQTITPGENIAEMLERTYYKERIQTLETLVADLEEQIRKINNGDK
jgi:hypothetical protein